MQPILLIAFLTLVLILGIALIALMAVRKSHAESDVEEQEFQPRGYYVSVGISIGAGFGVALGLVFQHLALGIAIGAALGVGIGAALEQRNRENMQPLSEVEQQSQGRWMIAVLALLILGLVVFGLILGWNVSNLGF